MTDNRNSPTEVTDNRNLEEYAKLFDGPLDQPAPFSDPKREAGFTVAGYVTNVSTVLINALEAAYNESRTEPTRALLRDALHRVKQRSEAGVKKYGIALLTWNGRDPLADAMMEEVDRWQYLVQARIERAQLLEALDKAKEDLAVTQRSLDTQREYSASLAKELDLLRKSDGLEDWKRWAASLGIPEGFDVRREIEDWRIKAKRFDQITTLLGVKGNWR